MPCHTDPPSQAEIAAAHLRQLVREIEGKKPNFKTDMFSFDGSRDLQANTLKLCAWCRSNTDKIKGMSLELQIWWRDHQEEDARHEREEAEKRHRDLLREKALKKLSPEERKALGV